MIIVTTLTTTVTITTLYNRRH